MGHWTMADRPSAEQKAHLDALHRHKVDLADSAGTPIRCTGQPTDVAEEASASP
ncbi:hypothetical protein JVX92_11550 [Microbacterium hominis]|uniref:hypothetical protein n=1 Tax=Microbacterium hominis TaxID=162426 RepID=UPI001964D6A7|nr:hypothetical protein [Microbacterium hominis]QRY40130.1 hypothetical protein JVX92_11550 [Microbacterium hominis]